MKKYFLARVCRKIAVISALILPPAMAVAQTGGGDAKMDAFVKQLMAKMTLDEKIGQLNLVTMGRAITGSVVNQGVEDRIKKGEIGGVFGVYGTADVAKIQDLAVLAHNTQHTTHHKHTKHTPRTVPPTPTTSKDKKKEDKKEKEAPFPEKVDAVSLRLR